MPVFGARSRARRETCHPLIQKATGLAIRHWDFTIISGWRGEKIQNDLVASGLSKTPWPQSQHNHLATLTDVSDGFVDEVGEPLSMAFDFAPWHRTLPHIRWRRDSEFYHMAGLIIGISEDPLFERGFRFRSGGDWDGDQDLYDQTFMDLGHLELRRI